MKCESYNALETPDTLGSRSTRPNTLSMDKISHKKGAPIFSFTEVLGSLNEEVTPTDQDPNEDCASSKASEAKVTFKTDETSLDGTLTTRYMTPEKSHRKNQSERIGGKAIVISEFRDRDSRPPRPIRQIKGSMSEILKKFKKLSMDVGKINQETQKTEAAYFKCLDEIDEKLQDPSRKFEFWKSDKSFVKDRTELKDEVSKFRSAYKESRKEKEKRNKLDLYIQYNGWEEEDKGDSKFNPIEKLLLREPKPFRIKKMLSKEEQYDLRPKPFDLNAMADIDLLLSEEKSELRASFNKLDRLRPGSVCDKLINQEWEKTVGDKYSEISFSSGSDDLSKEFCSNKVYYFAGIKSIRGHPGIVNKDQPKRLCTPLSMPIQSSKGASQGSYKSSYTAFKKSSLSRRK